MHKENLFELIRKEEVVIWAGAGLSLYAGYPSGKDLKAIIYNSLTEEEQKIVDINFPLQDLAEEVLRIRGNRNHLIRLLIKTFVDPEPTSTATHDSISIIPHFKTIITTNYDKLFENAYGKNGQVIYSNKQVGYFDKDKAQILKVHGDLSDPESIILTKSDYNNFFKEGKEDRPLWTVVKERIATKSILFLGYTLEDPNISVIFDKISESLDLDKRECFFVSPNTPEHKVNYLTKKGIHYINSKAETIIEELLATLKDNIAFDLQKGITSAETFAKYLFHNNLSANIETQKNAYKIMQIGGINGFAEGKFHFSVRDDGVFLKKLEDFIEGRIFGDIQIPEDLLYSTEMRMGGIKLPISDEVAKLKLQSSPKFKETIDLVFDGGFEINDIQAAVYGSKYLIETELNLKSALLILKIDPSKVSSGKIDISYKHNDLYNRVKDEIELFTLLKNVGIGKTCKVVKKDGKTVNLSLTPDERVTNEAEYFLEYFEGLKAIENKYGVRFKDIKHESIKPTYKAVSLLHTLIKTGYLVNDFKGEWKIEYTHLSKKDIEELQGLNESDRVVVAFSKEREVVDLHGQKINIGYKKSALQKPFVKNLDLVVSGKTKTVIFKSKDNKVYYAYSDSDES